MVVDKESGESCEERDDRGCEGSSRRRRERSRSRRWVWGESVHSRSRMDLLYSLRALDDLSFFAVEKKKSEKVQGVSRSLSPIDQTGGFLEEGGGGASALQEGRRIRQVELTGTSTH